MKRVVLDLEGDGLLEDVTVIWCGVARDIDTGEIKQFYIGQEDYINELLKFISLCDVVIAHNGLGYDFPALDKLYGFQYKGKVVDTLLLSRVHCPELTRPKGCSAGPHSVEAWGIRFNRHKPEHEDWSKFSSDMLHRCTEDVEIQTAIYNYLISIAEGNEWDMADRMTHKLFSILNKMEVHGWLVDQEHMHKAINRLEHWIERIDKAVTPRLPVVMEKGKEMSKPFKKDGDYTSHVYSWWERVGNGDDLTVRGPFTRVGFRKTNLNSNAEVKDFLLARGWQPQEWNVSKKTGEVTSPKLSYKDDFIGVQGSLGRLVAKRVQCRHRKSSIEGWLKLIRPDGRIPQSITGLASTGRATHTGIVNVPGADSFFGDYMRKCFIVPKGYKLVGTDSAGCQNRMLAARVGDDAFTKTLIEGKKEDETSIHFINRNAINSEGFSVSYHEAKTLNYAFMFGASNKKLGTTIGMDASAGERIRKALLGVAAGFEKLVTSLTEEWRSHAKRRKGRFGLEYYNGWVRGLDGRRVVIDSEHKILVYVLQSDEAIMMSAAICYLYDWCEKKGWKWGTDWALVGWIHDEYQCEVREELVDEFIPLAEMAITKAGELYNIACPHIGEAEVGNNWYETH